jgi:hypothetical protein
MELRAEKHCGGEKDLKERMERLEIKKAFTGNNNQSYQPEPEEDIYFLNMEE